MTNAIRTAGAALIASVSVAVSAATIPFSGDWDLGGGVSTGVMAPGVSWTATPDSWGSPGVGLGTLPWPDGDGFLDFHITFDLPPGIDVLFDLGTDCTGGVGGGTVFCTSPFPAGDVWSAVADMGPDGISFYAPPGVSLDAGDDYFVNIFFTGPVSGPVHFEGSWTMTGIPEPASLLLVGLGLAGLGLSRRKH